MSNLTPFVSPLDEVLSGFFVRPVNLESRGAAGAAAQCRIDVVETENAYRVFADLPGVRKQDINISIVGADVAITAEAKQERTAGESERVLLGERFAGKYHRALTLGHEIDDANAQARYTDGVLELTLPKSPDSMPKKITVQ